MCAAIVCLRDDQVMKYLKVSYTAFYDAGFVPLLNQYKFVYSQGLSGLDLDGGLTKFI